MTAGGEAWTDLQAFVALPRLTDLVVGPGGELAVAVSTLDDDATSYRSTWWQLDPAGERPARPLTRSVEGEGAAAYLPDGRLLFTSGRAVPEAGSRTGADRTGADGAAERRALWCLPAGGGEAYVAASRSGGFDSVTAAREGSRVVLGAALMPGATDLAQDEQTRASRRERKVTALLHESAQVRSWDHELGPDEPRLLVADLDERPEQPGASPTAPADLRVVAGLGRCLDSAPHLSAAGDLAVVTWATAGPRGVTRRSVVVLDLGPGSRAPQVLAAGTAEHDFHTPRISADGATVVCVREQRGTAAEPGDSRLYLLDRATGAGRVLAPDWDRWPDPEMFSADGSMVYVTVDENGHRPLYEVEVASGARRRLSDLGAYSAVRLSGGGRTLYALRTDYTDPGSVVAIEVATGVLTVLPRPCSYPVPPGRLENVEVLASDGARVRGYLLTPTTASRSTPAPLVLWVHGGPFSSWNAWSWRWCPWLLVARGYAVLLPDPALSTGYGRAMVARGWTDWGGRPYTDLMAITDVVEQRPDIDATATAAMGGSFGGYLVNWIAGHTDRFRCLVSHAGLWDLPTFLRTTDYPWAWQDELTPQLESASPSRFADAISTPMLVVHGDRDYRVPISEALALWWDLVSRHDGPPEELTHKFLSFPGENHWVLSPQHAVVWYETVLAFLAVHLRGGNFDRPAAL